MFVLIQTFHLIYSYYNKLKQRFHNKTLYIRGPPSLFTYKSARSTISGQTSCDLVTVEAGICISTKQICKDVHSCIPQTLTNCQFPVGTVHKVPLDWPGATSRIREQGFRSPHPGFLSLCLQEALERPQHPGFFYYSISPCPREGIWLQKLIQVLLLCI